MPAAGPSTFPLPVLCRYCGNYSTFGNLAHGTEVKFEFCSMTCAHCGGHVAIPDGTYRGDETLGGILFTSGISREAALTLIKYLRGLTMKDVLAEDIAEKIASEVPGAKKDNVLKILNQHGVSPTGIVAMLLALLLWYVGPRGSRSSALTERPVPVMAEPASPPRSTTPHRRKTPKLGRNDQCDCGSGKKAKYCHRDRCD